jgi:hypothetical protein
MNETLYEKMCREAEQRCYESLHKSRLGLLKSGGGSLGEVGHLTLHALAQYYDATQVALLDYLRARDNALIMALREKG